MSTESLKKDHDLIEKSLRALVVTINLLQSGKKIPESILLATVDFSKNFVNVCHHGKEEDSLFPELEKRGMPRHMGPIAMMLMEHEITKKIANRMEDSAKEYLKSGASDRLISDMSEYVDHVAKHLWKENNRLFVMAEMRLQGDSEQIGRDLDAVEKQKLESLGKSRLEYEKMVSDIEQDVQKLGSN